MAHGLADGHDGLAQGFPDSLRLMFFLLMVKTVAYHTLTPEEIGR